MLWAGGGAGRGFQGRMVGYEGVSVWVDRVGKWAEVKSRTITHHEGEDNWLESTRWLPTK